MLYFRYNKLYFVDKIGQKIFRRDINEHPYTVLNKLVVKNYL